MAKPKSSAYQEGKKKLYSARLRRDGYDVYVSGFRLKEDASKEAKDRLEELVEKGQPHGKGPRHTTLAHALQDYGMTRLKFMKGAPQEARRINKYLRAAGLQILVIQPVSNPETPKVRFLVKLKEETAQRKIPNGLHRHRAKLLGKTANSDAHRASLATKRMQEVRRNDLQTFVDAMNDEGVAPATIGLERALLRRLFNYARRTWNWVSLADNPALELTMPAIDNGRTRVLSEPEQVRLDEAIEECRNARVGPGWTLLRETAMRASEPVDEARWCDVDWVEKVIRLPDSKNSRRDVPLSPAALRALEELQALGPYEPTDRVLDISYEALRAAFRRACERAGVDGLRLQDLRHTAATRLALKTGNVFLVQALTGHKTLKMVERYVNVKASDVVAVMHSPEEPTGGSAGEPPVAAPVNSPPADAAAGAGAGAGVTVTLTQEQLDALMARAAVAGAAAVTAAHTPPESSDARAAASGVSRPNSGAGRQPVPTPRQGTVLPFRKAA
ncbi:site-specific integrase [Variovorax sp. J22R24]|uniref:tyrosine-type recombinase/integrase n=1 Tax=Variovorax gracilis TaxID=3053502 RepID=UPI002577ADB6|nr:site-specific integrase [Variovorax sp. J22R24]MDM0108684.1 site-specific integrase [Variovorax sp. J22R24]